MRQNYAKIERPYKVLIDITDGAQYDLIIKYPCGDMLMII